MIGRCFFLREEAERWIVHGDGGGGGVEGPVLGEGDGGEGAGEGGEVRWEAGCICRLRVRCVGVRWVSSLQEKAGWS